MTSGALFQVQYDYRIADTKTRGISAFQMPAYQA